MTLRARLIAYLAVIHAIFAVFAVAFLLEARVWLIAAEIVLAASLIIGIRLASALMAPLQLVSASAKLLAERDFTSRLAPLGHPEMDALVAVYNRMADQLRAERVRLQEQHFFFHRIVEASPIGILTLDWEERVTLANPAARRMLQKEEAELSGRPLDEIPGELPQALAAIPEGESALVAVEGRRRLKCSRGSFIEQGHPRGFVTIEELTGELRRSEREAWERMIRMMSHEVNNSIAAANSLLHSCLTYAGQIRPEDRADFEKALRVVISRTDHLTEFMDRCASVVRIPPPILRPTDIEALLQDVAGLFRAECESHGIDWRWELKVPLGVAAVDRPQMEQVLVNVVRNALDAIGRAGRITIRSDRRDGRRRLEIEDSGPGFPQEVAAQLFTPFFTTRPAGHGVGLTIVAEILQQHGFDYALDSRPGEPTRFTVVLDGGGAAVALRELL